MDIGNFRSLQFDIEGEVKAIIIDLDEDGLLAFDLDQTW